MLVEATALEAQVSSVVSVLEQFRIANYSELMVLSNDVIRSC